jgi:AraC-like DNA-binding protein
MESEVLIYGNTATQNLIQIAHLPVGNYDFTFYHTGLLDEKAMGFWHSHPCYELYYVSEGSFTILVGGKKKTVSEKDMLLLMPETIHYVEHLPNEKKTYYTLLFNLNHLNPGQTRTDRRTAEAAAIDNMLRTAHEDCVLVPTQGKESDIFEQTFLEMQDEIREMSFGWNISLNILCLRVLIHAIRQMPLTPEKSVPVGERGNIAILLVDYLRNHYAENITIDDLAEELFISPRHVSRIFKKMFNTTFGDILRTFRVDAAKYLIGNSNLTDSEIAKAVGLGSEQTLLKQIKKKEDKSR